MYTKSWVVHTVDKKVTHKMVEFMLKSTGRETFDFKINGLSITVHRLHPNMHTSVDHPAEIGTDKHPSFKLSKGITQVGNGWIDKYRERKVRLVWVARIVFDLNGGDRHGITHLRRRESGAIRIGHGLDQVIDESLHFIARKFIHRDLSTHFSSTGSPI